jgi:Domain of unknown function (DUF4270)
MYTRLISLFLLCGGIIAVLSCNKSTTFGGDILNDQTLNTIFTDTVAIKMRMLEEDSVITSDPASTADFHLCGQIDDPVLGVSSATVYSGLQLSSLKADFKNTQLDSVVLYLGVDPDGVYGDTTKPLDFEVRLLDEHPSRSKPYYSNQSMPVSSAPGALLGTGSYLPTPRIGRPLIDTTTAVRDSAFGAWFSMRLDPAFGQKVLAMDSATLNNDTLFWAQIKGIQIKSKTSGAVLGLNLNDRTFSRITLYYRKDTALTVQRVFNMQFVGEQKFSQYERTPSSFITDRIGNTLTDDFMAVQGLASHKLEIEIPHIAHPDKQDWLVNTAEIVLYGANVNNDNLSKFLPAKQLAATISLGDTAYALLPDINYSFNVSGSTFNFFGGSPKEEVVAGNPVKRYAFSIPSHLQNMISDTTTENKFYINLYPLSRSAERVLFHSPGAASPLHARLHLRYTKVQ